MSKEGFILVDGMGDLENDTHMESVMVRNAKVLPAVMQILESGDDRKIQKLCDLTEVWLQNGTTKE